MSCGLFHSKYYFFVVIFQGKYIHSRKLHSFNDVAFRTEQKYLFNSFPSRFIIIISFINTVSWMNILRNCWAYFKLWVIAQDVPFAFCLEVAFMDKTYSNALRSRSAFMRTYRKTSFRSRANLWITLVELTYPKEWTGGVPLCPPFFLDAIKCNERFRLTKQNKSQLLLWNI